LGFNYNLKYKRAMNEEAPSNAKKKFLIETLDVLVTGNGKNILHDIILMEQQVEFIFDKGYSSQLMKKYNENLCKFQGVPNFAVGVGLSQDKERKKVRKAPTEEQQAEKNSIKIGEFTLLTRTFASDEFLLNMNFHMVGNSIFDPYISEYITSTVNMLVYTFNINDEVGMN
jgi:hypothetical protein